MSITLNATCMWCCELFFEVHQASLENFAMGNYTERCKKKGEKKVTRIKKILGRLV